MNDKELEKLRQRCVEAIRGSLSRWEGEGDLAGWLMLGIEWSEDYFREYFAAMKQMEEQEND